MSDAGFVQRRFDAFELDERNARLTREGVPVPSLMVSQAVTESVLLERFVALGGRVLRPRTLVDLAQDEHGVTATLDDGSCLRARYVVGAEGMHSTGRERARIAFSGGSYGDLAAALEQALAGKFSALDAHDAQRRPVAQQVVAFADRLTRLGTLRPGLRGLLNLLLSTVSKLPAIRR
jgi:2-polyprenyl-6-methoxyphenol hydroxylase-like FAD-dependent oxidoreductase